MAGIGMVGGKECMVTISDATIKGGSMYPLSVKKTLRCQTIAMENRLPFINLMDSAGAFLPMQSEIFPDIDDGGRVFFNQARMSKMGIPQIVGVMGLCTAGGAYGVAMCDEIVHVKGHGAIFLGGPPLVKAATGDEVSADELGGAAVHCRESGVSDYIAEDDPHAIAIIRQIVENLPDSEKSQLSVRSPEPPLYDPKELYGIVSPDLSKPVEIREVIARMVDGSRFLEFKEIYGPTLVTGWAHIHGYPVGILANNGILFSQSAQKGTQFIQLCDRRKIPLVFIQNINGFIVGKAYERGGITKDGHKMVNAVSNCHRAQIHRHGGGLLRRRQLRHVRTGLLATVFVDLAQRTRSGSWAGQQAADVLITLHQRSAGQAPRPVPHEPTKKSAFILPDPVIDGGPQGGRRLLFSTSNLWDDGILDPAKTRDVLGLGTFSSLNARFVMMYTGTA